MGVRYIDGKLCVKIKGMPPGEWYSYEHKVDSLLDHVRRELGPPFLHDSYICILASIRPTSLSPLRKGVMPRIPAEWFLHLNDLSGIPIAELRRVADTVPEVVAHPNARKPRKDTPPLEIEDIDEDYFNAS